MDITNFPPRLGARGPHSRRVGIPVRFFRLFVCSIETDGQISIARVPHRSASPSPAPDGCVLPGRLPQIPSPTVLPPGEPRPTLAPSISRSDAILSRPISQASWQALELLVTLILRSPRRAHSPCPTSTANNPRSPIWLLAVMFPAGSGRS